MARQHPVGEHRAQENSSLQDERSERGRGTGHSLIVASQHTPKDVKTSH